jgi:hypothetical protein
MARTRKVSKASRRIRTRQNLPKNHVTSSRVPLIGAGLAQGPHFAVTAKARSVPRGYNGALRLLWAAYNDAREVGREPIEFSVELGDFFLLAITRSDLRRLVSQGHAEHLVDMTPKHARERRLVSVDTLHFTEVSCFMLTESGAALVRKLRSDRRSSPVISSTARIRSARHQPHWDAGARELWLGRTLVKRFRHAAPNQERILTVFQEENWPRHIDDPLPPREGLDSKRRLHDTVNKLNQHQLSSLIHFHGNGTGTGVCWAYA